MDSLERLLSRVSATQAQDESVHPQLVSKCAAALREIAERNSWTLYLDGFDDEQIWAQAALNSLDPSNTFILPSEPNHPQEPPSSLQVEVPEDSLEAESYAPREPLRPGEDDFFKLSEMEQFVEQAEMDEEDPALSSGMEEESDEEEQEDEAPQYSTFFRDPNEPEEAEEAQERVFTSLLDSQIDQLEEKLVSDKPWQLRGEVSSTSRPVDSLLTENLDFQMASTAAPLTHIPDVADELEYVIKQRILDMNYDDPRPKVQVKVPETAKNADFMDFEKSKKSLAELYEEDYKKDVLHLPIVTEQEAAKREAAAIWRKLCYNLDLLASLNPIPRPKVSAEMQVKPAAVPAIAMEEAIPFGVSQESVQPPQALYNPKSAVLKSESELTSTDHAHIRRKSKTAMRTRKKERLLRLVEKAAQDPRGEKFEYRRLLKETRARKELIERKKQVHHKFTKSSEFFKTVAGLKEEEGMVKKKRKVEQVKL